MASKETQCSKCEHLQVCKYKDGFLDLVVKTDNLISDHEEYTFANLILKCNHFSEVKVVPRSCQVR